MKNGELTTYGEPVPQRVDGVKDEGFQYEIANVNECIRQRPKESLIMTWDKSLSGIRQFDQFSNETGIEIGIKLLELAKSEGKSIAVDISKGRQQIFHAALEGMTPDHAEWLRRKTNTVYRFHSSTLKLHLHLKEHNKTLTEIFQVDPYDYVDDGAGFPIQVLPITTI